MITTAHRTPHLWRKTLVKTYFVPSLNMPPKRSARNSRRKSPTSGPEPGLVHSPPADNQHGGPVPAKKRPTVADNAMAIQSMESKMGTMSELLNRIAQNVCPPAKQPQASAAPLPEADPENYAPRRVRPVERTPPPHRPYSAPHSERDAPRDWHSSAQTRPASARPTARASSREEDLFNLPAPYRSISEVDPRVPRPGLRPLRDFPTNLHGFEDDTELQSRVAGFLSATFAPAHSAGKKHFAHSFIARGLKRSKTTLGDLSIPEYTTGFIRLINHPDTQPSDRPHMFKHLEFINEDAINYSWPDVRAWSEEVCSLVGEGALSWSDEYRLDILRLKLSQENRLHLTAASTANHKELATAADVSHHLTPEVRAAKPGPPCKHFNAGTCTFTTDHVTNGYRQLHVCTYCLSAKCLFWPHADKGCRSKEFIKKRQDQQPGFGK